MADKALRARLSDWLKTSLKTSSEKRGSRWRQTELSKASGVSRATIYSILEAKADADTATIRRLAAALEVGMPQFTDSEWPALSSKTGGLPKGADIETIYNAAIGDAAAWSAAHPAYALPAQRAIFWINELRAAIGRDRDVVERVLKREIAELHEQLAKQGPGARRASGSAD